MLADLSMCENYSSHQPQSTWYIPIKSEDNLNITEQYNRDNEFQNDLSSLYMNVHCNGYMQQLK